MSGFTVHFVVHDPDMLLVAVVLALHGILAFLQVYRGAVERRWRIAACNAATTFVYVAAAWHVLGAA